VEKDINGQVLRQYVRDNAKRLGFDPDPSLPPESWPYAPSFHPVFRIESDGSLRTDMVVELVQTKRVPFDADMPSAGSFPFRGGVTLIISAPEIYKGRDYKSRHGKAWVRFAIGKPITGVKGKLREDRQRLHHMAMGLASGNTEDPKHFQVDFGLLHEGL
jgi:hypothetical protein